MLSWEGFLATWLEEYQFHNLQYRNVAGENLNHSNFHFLVGKDTKPYLFSYIYGITCCTDTYSKQFWGKGLSLGKWRHFPGSTSSQSQELSRFFTKVEAFNQQGFLGQQSGSSPKISLKSLPWFIAIFSKTTSWSPKKTLWEDATVLRILTEKFKMSSYFQGKTCN